MSIVRHQVICWFTTPTELRRIAQQMEELWPKLRPGQDKTVSVKVSSDTELRILIDQELIEIPGWLESPERSAARIKSARNG